MPKLDSSEQELAWQAHQQQLRQVAGWTLRGKIAVKTEEDSFSANLHWKQSGDSYRILLTNFLGTTLMQLEGGAGHAQLTMDNQTHFASSSEALLKRMTGWELPVAALRYWMLGLPEQGQSQYQLNAQGLLANFSAQPPHAWQLDYSSYTNADPMPLPKKLTLKHDQIRIRIVASNWKLNQL